MRKLSLILALAALLLPGLSLADTTETPRPAAQNLTFEEFLLGNSCANQSATVLSPPGCAKPCKTDLNCPYYPEQVCLSGCCTF
jgi:hypothetical protein